MRYFRLPILILWAILFATACNDDPQTVVETPATYEFLRNGSSSVSVPGQVDRIDQLREIKALLNSANAGNLIDAQDLLDMFSNEGGDGGGNFSFSSVRQLKDKTDAGERLVLENLMESIGTASAAGQMGTPASNGQAGLLIRTGNQSTILVNEKGQEFNQLIEKGIMGATFYYQITSTYLTAAEIGNQVDNETIVPGENYTDMEHHWDEAFGYLSVPPDFRSNWPSDRNGEASFLGNYIREMDPVTGSADLVMDPFKKGRNAIVLKEYAIRDEQRDLIYRNLEIAVAAAAIHYINDALASLGDEGEFHHTLTEAYAFIRALSFSPRATLANSEITQLLKEISDDSYNFWNATQNGLNSAKSTLSVAFGLEAVQDDL